MHGQKAVCLVLIITAFLLVPIPSQVFAISEFNWELRAYRDFSVACAFSTSDANPPGNDVLRIHCGDRIASDAAMRRSDVPGLRRLFSSWLFAPV